MASEPCTLRMGMYRRTVRAHVKPHQALNHNPWIGHISDCASVQLTLLSGISTGPLVVLLHGRMSPGLVYLCIEL